MQSLLQPLLAHLPFVQNVIGSTQAANTFLDNLLMHPASIFALVAIALYLTLRARPGSSRFLWKRAR